MPSENAQAVANEVIETVRKGQKVSLRKIAKKHGYSQSIADKPQKITTTKSYQEVMRPVVDRMIEERDRAIAAMAARIDEAKYRDLTDAADKLTKNIQLLSGGATENIAAKVVYLPERKDARVDTNRETETSA